MNQFAKGVIVGSLIVAAIVIFIKWSEDHDVKVEVGAKAYEECVRSQYGVSPANWYEDHGSYPECK